jgi:hypothetical protein
MPASRSACCIESPLAMQSKWIAGAGWGQGQCTVRGKIFTSSAVDSYSAGQQNFPPPLEKFAILFVVDRYLIHTFTLDFSEVHFNITLPSTSESLRFSLLFSVTRLVMVWLISLRILEVPGSEFIVETGHPDWGFSWFCSVPRRKCRSGPSD